MDTNEIIIALFALLIGFVFKAVLQNSAVKTARYDTLLDQCAELQVAITKLKLKLDSDIENLITPSQLGGGIDRDGYSALFHAIQICSVNCQLRSRDKKLEKCLEDINSLVASPEKSLQGYLVTDQEEYREEYEGAFRSMPEEIEDLSAAFIKRVKKIG